MKEMENESLRKILGILTETPCAIDDAVFMAGLGREHGRFVIKRAMYSGELKITVRKTERGKLKEYVSRKPRASSDRSERLL